LALLDVPDVPDPHPGKVEVTAMIAFIDWFIPFINWFIPGLIGLQFTLLGSLKLYGLCRGVVGGADKSFITRLCGT
jgi:hypothetical protein